MGDNVNERGEGVNLTPGGLRRVDERLRRETPTHDDEDIKKLGDDWQPGLFISHNSGQNLTEVTYMSLLCIYERDAPPLIVHLSNKAHVDMFFDGRGDGCPVYELKYCKGRVTLGDRLDTKYKENPHG